MERWVAYIILMLLLIASPALAQHNKYKIDDSLYPLFMAADSARYTKDGVKLANKLYKKAVELGDKKAQCLAHTVYVHYAKNMMPDSLKSEVEKLKSISRKNGYLQYYYFGWMMYINKLTEEGDTYEALQETFKMRDQSQKDNNPYGIANCYKLLGNLFWERGNYEKALEYYQEGLEYYKKDNPSQDPMVYYYRIARYNALKGNYQKAIDICNEGAKYALSGRTLLDLQLLKGLTYAQWGKKKELFATDAEIERTMKTIDMGDKPEYKQLQVFMAIYKGDYALAHHWAEQLTNDEDSIASQEDVYEAEGNLKAALECQKKLYQMYVAKVSQLQSSDLAKVSTIFGNERIKAQAWAEKEALKHKVRLAFSMIGLTILIAIIIVLVYSRNKARNFIKQLTHKNEELEIARNKAEESEKMKTMFVQNVTHEIRTPLNAILGFTDLLLNPDFEVDNEEKKEFKRLVRHNTNLLTGLINDVLTLSELQSGKAKLNLSQCRCNNLCRLAMSTVEHRKPDGVEMTFTTDVDDDMTINTDERRVTQVLVNFLTNAEKYTSQGSITLDCSTAKASGYLTFTVTDTGCGIPKEKQQLIFGRFEKLDDFHQGLGLGLNICARIAGMLNANIGVDPDYHEGARFYLAIPLEKQQKTSNKEKR